MKLVCAWCGVAIDRPGYAETQDRRTSHGMCPACHEAFVFQERGASLQQHLDSISMPVLLLDDNNIVVTMNAKARAALGKKLNETETQLFGRVFDCLHSRSSEGCGRAIHCSGCVIRRCVAATFDTGEPQTAVPAVLNTTSPDQLSEAVLAVTTVKVGELVLLRIE